MIIDQTFKTFLDSKDVFFYLCGRNFDIRKYRIESEWNGQSLVSDAVHASVYSSKFTISAIGVMYYLLVVCEAPFLLSFFLQNIYFKIYIYVCV